jgi:hypothetical protein
MEIFFSEMAVLPCEIGTVWQGRVHWPQSRQRCACSMCLKWCVDSKSRRHSGLYCDGEMKFGYLITHLWISDTQCNGATHTHQQWKKFKTSQSNRKFMAALFWDRKGSLLVNILPRGATINAAAYCEMLKKLCRAIQNKRRGMLMRGVCLLHNNACPHTARAM